MSVSCMYDGFDNCCPYMFLNATVFKPIDLLWYDCDVLKFLCTKCEEITLNVINDIFVTVQQTTCSTVHKILFTLPIFF